MQGFADPRSIAGGWAQAWRGWRDNPLSESYSRAQQQREAALAWHRRSPGLLIAGVLLGLGAAAANIWLLIDSVGQAGPGARPFIAANASLGIGVTLASALLFSLLWLAARTYSAYTLALGFLERAPRTRFRHSVDDMLAVTALTEQELLAGALRFGMGRIAPPLAACCAALALLTARLLPQYAGSLLDSAPSGALLVVLAAAALFAMLFIGGLLCSAAVLLCSLALSVCEQAGPWPAIGAGSLVGMQTLFAAGLVALQLNYTASGLNEPASAAGVRFGAGAILLLLIGLLLYIARRSEGLRRGLAANFNLVLLVPYLIVAGGVALGDMFESPEATMVWLLRPLEPLLPINPLLLLESAQLDSGSGEWSLLRGPLHWLLYLPLQLVFVAISAEFARDSIRRRKWGGSA